MNDKRDTQRQNVMKAGTILFGGSGIDCLVRNISVGGADLEVESKIGIPSSFDLVIEAEHSNHHCVVVCRKARRIDVAFDYPSFQGAVAPGSFFYFVPAA